MSANLLTLNPAKTEFMLIGLPQQLAKIPHPSLSPTPDTAILPSVSARNLGFIFGICLDFSQQISTLSKSCFFTSVTYVVSVPLLTTKLPAPLPLLLCISNLTTATFSRTISPNSLPAVQFARLQHIQNSRSRSCLCT